LEGHLIQNTEQQLNVKQTARSVDRFCDESIQYKCDVCVCQELLMKDIRRVNINCLRVIITRPAGAQ